MNDLLRKIAAKGYGWYLALKIGKAVMAVPLFVGYIALCLVVAALLGAWHAGKGVLWDFPRMMTGEMAGYWDKHWFRHFGRNRWEYLYRRAEPVPLPPIDIVPEQGEVEGDQ